MCRLYGVTRAGYYAWRERPVSVRRQEDEALSTQIRRVHEESRRTYGSPRIYRELRGAGVSAGENRIARLMRAEGITARSAKRTYNRAHMKRFYAAVPNRALEVEPSGADQVWVGDITYLKVGAIYRYLAVVMDKYSRRILSWAFGKTREVKLTLRALNSALHIRRPPPGLIFHSDRGMEYAATPYKERLAQLGIAQSMNRPGKMNDNVYIESFFHSMKSDIVHGLQFDEDHEIVAEIRRYMPFYNNTRLHSSLGYVPPATYEQQLA
jgi:transposase InsO family protein